MNAEIPGYLRWRCRRGMLEMDLLLNAFLDTGYAGLNPEQRRIFEAMLEESDTTLLPWLLGRAAPADPAWQEVALVIRRAAQV
jgi:antitoxin CptB